MTIGTVLRGPHNLTFRERLRRVSARRRCHVGAENESAIRLATDWLLRQLATDLAYPPFNKHWKPECRLVLPTTRAGPYVECRGVPSDQLGVAR